MMRIFITNLGKYNEGNLVGEWVTLPIEKDELENALEKIEIDNEYYEEYFITDYEFHGFKINEYDSIEELNEMAERVENLDNYEIDVLNTLSDYYDFDECMEIIENRNYMIYYNVDDMSDVAEQYIEECGILENVPDDLKNYFDYESYGRNMDIQGFFYFTNDRECIEVFH